MQINWLNVWTGGSFVLLAGTNSAILILALAWAISGLFGLAPQLAAILYTAGGVLSLMATAAFARMAHEAEPFFERDPSSVSQRAVAWSRKRERG